MSEKKSELRIVDDLSVKPIYVNKFLSSAFDGGAIVLTFGETRFVPEQTKQGLRAGGPPTIFLTARLAISPNATIDLFNNLREMLVTLSAKGGLQSGDETQKSH